MTPLNVRSRAAEALPADAFAAERALIVALEGRDVTAYSAGTFIRALEVVGSTQATSVLERLARSRVQRRRDAATLAFLRLAKPPDPAAEARRLFWEAPDTDLERAMLFERRGGRWVFLCVTGGWIS